MEPQPIVAPDLFKANTARPCYVSYNRALGFELWSEMWASELYQYDQQHRQVPPGFMGNRPDVLGQS